MAVKPVLTVPVKKVPVRRVSDGQDIEVAVKVPAKLRLVPRRVVLLPEKGGLFRMYWLLNVEVLFQSDCIV